MANVPENMQQLLNMLQDTATQETDAADRFRLSNGQLARIAFKREKNGQYPTAAISLHVPRAEQAIMAALVALQGTRVEMEDLLRVDRALLAARWSKQTLKALAEGESEPEVPARLDKATSEDTFSGYGYMYVEDLLRHYRPDFDDLPYMDQAALVSRVLEKSNVFLDALRELALCVQHADPYEGLPNNPVKKAARDVRAAELRYIEELTYVEIGKRLGINQSSKDEDRNDNYRVREQLVKRGREILKSALGEDGYEQYVNSSKAEKDRWRSMVDGSRYIERWAEMLNMPTERMRRVMVGTNEEWAEEAAALDERELFGAVMARASWQQFFK